MHRSWRFGRAPKGPARGQFRGKQSSRIVERLEPRLLMDAGSVDLAVPTFSDLDSDADRDPVAVIARGGEASSMALAPPNGAEGEGMPQSDAPDLVAFARALSATGAKFYGAAWCPRCTEQKELFEDGGGYLPFVEVTHPDRVSVYEDRESGAESERLLRRERRWVRHAARRPGGYQRVECGGGERGNGRPGGRGVDLDAGLRLGLCNVGLAL